MQLAMTLEELVPEARLGHYTIIEHVAEGGMGHVFRAFEPSLSREVAIKVLKAELAQDSEKITAFDMEAQNIAALRHSNIVPIYFVGHQGDLHYFVMPFITGSTLDEWVESGASMNAEQGLMVLNQAVEALDWAYKNGIVHLDIKPSNFLIDNSGVILLTDFGLARTMGATILENADECFGTPAYMCPEQILQQPTDQRSDIYSLGATMYHLMTNHFIYDCETISELVQAHLESPFPHSEASALGLAPGWVNLLDRMTQKSPGARYQSYDELRRALLNVDRLTAVKKTRSEKEIAASQVLVPLRGGATKEYAYGFLHSSFNSWAETTIDPNLKKKREDTLRELQKPLRPLQLPKIVAAIKEMQKSQVPDLDDLVDALLILPTVDDYVIALAHTGFASEQGKSDISRKKAIRIVGPSLVSQLILTSLMWRNDFVGNREFVWKDFWQHSISTGVITHYLMKAVMGEFTPGRGRLDHSQQKITSLLSLTSFLTKNKENYFLAGLVHDIGKLVLAEVAIYPYYSALREAIDRTTTLQKQEKIFLGIDHAEAGELWLGSYGMEGYLKQAAAKHHDFTSKVPPVVAAVAVANQLVKIYGLGYSGSPIVDVRNLWATKVWKDLQASCKKEYLTPELMEEHFVPLVSQLPLLEPLER